MAFDIGSFFGGGLSGAAAGSAFGPIGTIAGGLLGGLGGAFGGGGPAEYQMTPLQEELSSYGFDQVKASPKTRKSIINQYKNIVKSGNRGGAEAFLESYRNRFSNSDFVENRLARSYGKELDYGSPSYRDTVESIYGSQGLGFTGEEYKNFANRAKALNIRSPQAFADMVRKDLIASGKVATPQQEMLSYMFGTPERDASGKLTNRYPTIEKYQPRPLPEAITYQYGA